MKYDPRQAYFNRMSPAARAGYVRQSVRNDYDKTGIIDPRIAAPKNKSANSKEDFERAIKLTIDNY